MKIINLEKNIGSFQLKIDHLYIEPGRIHGLAGHNGCGKTILLKTIMGIMEPDRGEIDLEGLDRYCCFSAYSWQFRELLNCFVK